MSKLFLFGIGGTGARVIKSLVMLMAAGVDIRASRIVPILIDPDARNGDTVRTLNLLKLYKSIHGQLGNREKGFFKTDIATLQDVWDDKDGKLSSGFNFPFLANNETFENFVDYHTLSNASQDLLSLLFSKQSRESTLEVGFKGNPNIGSIVLNKLTDSPEFRAFGKAFNPGDRIFIISSIFGGTGASGFPLLLKKFRSAESTYSGAGAISNAIIGALTVKPYFGLQDNDKSAIDSNTFITKTKAALAYYQNNLKGLNALYYLADSIHKSYSNSEGGEEQKNQAHVVELIGALSVIDFLEYRDAELNEGRTVHHEYGLKSDARSVKEIGFGHLSGETKNLIGQPLTQLKVLAKHYTEHLKDATRHPYYESLELGKKLDTDPFYRELGTFFREHFYPWLRELNDNDRALRLYNLNGDLSLLINGGKQIREGKVFKTAVDFTYLDGLFTNLRTTVIRDKSPRDFMEMMYQGTAKLFEENIKPLP
jgi:hypothetical protein